MFTQCPDCQTTFRVTVQVLQLAGGRVRCGGCGIAFNALEYMSEEDKRKAETEAIKESTSDQNRQLLETLDKLAGPDVTLEDTGVEWRVLEESEKVDPDATGSMPFVIEGDDETSDAPAMLGRQGDMPKPASDAQESLDLTDTEPEQPIPSERRYDDNTILPDDFGDEEDLDELPFLEKPETPKRRAGDREAVQDTADFADAQVDLALGEPDEWVDLLDEVAEQDQEEVAVEEHEEDVAVEASVEEETPPVEDDIEDEPTVRETPEDDMPSDINTQFLLQAEEMGIDTGSHPVIEAADSEESDEAAEEDEAADAEEDDDDDLEKTDIVDPDAEEKEEDKDEPLSIEDIVALEHGEDEEEIDEEDAADLESTGEFEAQIDVAGKALAGEDAEKDEESTELELAEDAADSGDIEELEDEDAFATALRSGKDVRKLFDEDSPTVETIIMEGDAFGDALEEQARKQAASTFENPGPLEDTYSLRRGKVRGGRRANDPPSYAVMASIVVLGLLLVVQTIHQSRQTLATYGAFNHTIGSIYRALGKPVTPEWDVRGWQFEATSNSVDEEQDLLTIYSRIANKSGQPLPYPLVHISLTDRWEDIIGSRVLEPNEYLAGDLDPSKPVPVGENFTAVITIESPSAEATGFKLTVCYRVAQGRVRCATQDFKN